jgi:hypothetical protein
MVGLVIKSAVIAALIVFALPMLPFVRREEPIMAMVWTTAAVIAGLFTVRFLKLA